MASQILYLDPFSGVSGNMFVGALLDLGLEPRHLEHELAKLKLDGYRLRFERVTRRGVAAFHFDVALEGHAREHAGAHGHAPPHAHRSFADIRALIEASGLSAGVKARSLRAFGLLAEAEGRIHGRPLEQVHFHEVGAVDSIVDFVGACIGLEALGVAEVWCGPVAVGEPMPAEAPAAETVAPRGRAPGAAEEAAPPGYIRCAHGWLPLPAFATLELLKGIPLRPCPIAAELTTPTGAALVKALATRFGPLRDLDLSRIGYGAGTRDDPHIPIPNVLRAALGTRAAAPALAPAPTSAADADPLGAGALPAGHKDTVVEMQANVDDATPEVLGFLAEKLLAQGALDVSFTAVQMKKNRPGTLVTVLAPAAGPLARSLAETLFRETPAFGLRYAVKPRLKLVRESREVATPWGAVRVKFGRWGGALVSAHPEYEDCRALAERSGVPLRQIIEAARQAAGQTEALTAPVAGAAPARQPRGPKKRSGRRT